MIVGFAVDFGYASYVNQRLAKATDAATLAAVSQTAATAAGGYQNLSGLQTYGVSVFNANMSQNPATGATFSLSVVSDGAGGVVSQGTYKYNSPAFFASILGFSNFPLSGSASTTARPLIYVNYYILVDASQSMGIAATQTDMDTLYARVAANHNGGSGDVGCVFGCHVLGPGQSVTNEDLAHNITRNWGPRINLRIDAAVTAIQSIIAQAQTIAGTTKNVQFALYTIQEDPTTNKSPDNLIRTVASTQNNYAALSSAAATIDLGNNNSGGTGDTDFHNELSAFSNILTNANVTQQGSGASSSAPVNYVFIVTDGLADVQGNCAYGHCTSAFSASDCTSLQAKANVGVIYTTYNPIYTNNDQRQGLDQRYKDLVQGNINGIPGGLQSCASSPDYYFEASDGTDIVNAMQTLFQRTQPVSARLTQ